VTDRTVLAVDLGGSALKACLLDVGGATIASASLPLSFREERSGWSEQDPELWWRALSEACAALSAQAGTVAPPSAVAICGFTRTQVLLDRSGAAVRPAIGFRDARASGVAEALLARPDIAAHPQARHLNGFHPLARLAWLAANEPAAYAATEVVLEPKDFLVFRLTGRRATDAISQLRLIEAVAGTPSLAGLAGLAARAIVPRIAAPSEVVGTVRSGLPGPLATLAGAAVVCGSHDTLAAVAGLGALRPGLAYGISGSSEVFGLLSARDADAEGLLSVRWGDVVQIGGPGLNGANVVNHVLALAGPGDRPVGETLDALLARATASRPLLMLPFLHGERVPYWNADLRAAILGLSAEHSAGDVLRAAMEGVAFLNRVVLDRAEGASGTTAREIRFGGGGARSAAWNQIRADVLGRPVLAAPDAEMGLLGCLAFARVGLGLERDVASAAEALPRGLTSFRPDPSRAARYDRLFAAFAAAVGPVTELSKRLADIR
jgi:xylulokinase